MTMHRPAVFLDRDGTLNTERGYVTRPDELQLLPGVGAALVRLRLAGFACVVVSNQSAVGRGMMSEADLERIHAELRRQLAVEGAVLDGVYACTSPIDHPERKPAPGLLLKAARELHLDLARSWMIGDSMRDLHAGLSAGCLGCILVRTGHPIDESQFPLDAPFAILDDLPAAVRHILESSW